MVPNVNVIVALQLNNHMAKNQPERKKRITAKVLGIQTQTPPPPDFIAVAREDQIITSCRGCGESCPWGSLPGGSECIVQNAINLRRRSSRG